MTTQLNQHRDLSFDLIRACCVLYIIGIWHFNGYLRPDLHFSVGTLDVLHRLTEVVLGIFTFISGFFLKKYNFSNKSDCIRFYKKRFERFLIPLLIASVSYCLLGWIKMPMVFETFMGINMFCPKQLPTLWFFSMMVLFYLIMPLIKWNYSKKRINYIISILMLMFFCLVCNLELCDERTLLYFPCFLLGLFLPSAFFEKNNSAKAVLLISVSAIMFYVAPKFIVCGGGVLPILTGVLGVCNFMSLFSKYIPTFLYAIISFISYGSMMAYLFHRQLFGAVGDLCEVLFHVSYVPLIIAIVTLIITFVLSFYGQKLYDKLIRIITTDALNIQNKVSSLTS